MFIILLSSHSFIFTLLCTCVFRCFDIAINETFHFWFEAKTSEQLLLCEQIFNYNASCSATSRRSASNPVLFVFLLTSIGWQQRRHSRLIGLPSQLQSPSLLAQLDSLALLGHAQSNTVACHQDDQQTAHRSQ